MSKMQAEGAVGTAQPSLSLRCTNIASKQGRDGSTTVRFTFVAEDRDKPAMMEIAIKGFVPAFAIDGVYDFGAALTTPWGAA